MFKWIGGSVAGVLVVGLLLFGGRFFGYAKTGVDEVRRAADDAVPMSVKVANAERLVRDLEPEIKKHMKLFAEQEVEFTSLEDRVAKRNDGLDKAKGKILALKAKLDTGDKQYVFEGQSYSADEVRDDLGNKVNRYKSESEALKREQELLKARREALSITKERLNQMVSAKRDLETQVAALRLRMDTQKAAEAVGTSEFDESKMADARRLIDELNKKMDVNDKVRQAESRLHGEIDVPEREVRDVSKEVEDLFGDEAKPKQDL